MKSLPLNLSSMQKIGGDKNHSQFEHKDGHIIIIAHAPLPALQRKQLEKLPIKESAKKDIVKKLNSGGEATNDTDIPTQPTPDNNTNSVLAAMGQAVSNPQAAVEKARSGNTQHYAEGTADASNDSPPQDQTTQQHGPVIINVGAPAPQVAPASIYSQNP